MTDRSTDGAQPDDSKYREGIPLGGDTRDGRDGETNEEIAREREEARESFQERNPGLRVYPAEVGDGDVSTDPDMGPPAASEG